MRQLKISETSKFWGESSSLVSVQPQRRMGTGGRALPLEVHGLVLPEGALLPVVPKAEFGQARQCPPGVCASAQAFWL